MAEKNFDLILTINKISQCSLVKFHTIIHFHIIWWVHRDIKLNIHIVRALSTHFCLEMKIKFLWPKVLGATGPERRCELPCMGSRADASVDLDYFTIYFHFLSFLIILKAMTDNNEKIQTADLSSDYNPLQ